MKINQEFFDFIEPALKSLKEKTCGDFIVFGSAVMYLLGILEFKKEGFFHDLDIMLKNQSNIPKEAALTYYQGDKNRKLYRIYLEGFEIDIGGQWPETKEFFERSFDDPLIINGYKFISLDKLQEWKEMMARPKDLKHVEKIKEFKKKTE
jgi:hypothetical protein